MGCVVGDGVRIEDGVVLQGCVVCAGAVLREKCSLRDCQVPPPSPSPPRPHSTTVFDTNRTNRDSGGR
jgi:NDP-sugar pyrophosphorylase family protein